MQTTLDPRFTCKDNLVGSLAGVGLPELTTGLEFKYFSLKGKKFKEKDIVRVTYLSRTVMAAIIQVNKKSMKVLLKEPLCIIDKCSKLSISTTVNNQFRLVGVGTVNVKNKEKTSRTFKNIFGHQLEEYPKLLEHVCDICVLKTSKKSIIKLTPPECEKQGGARTVWTNFGLIVQELDKPLDHFKSFITSELGTTTSLSAKNALVLYGSYRPNNFESLIRSYVKKYCKCDSCGNHDTDVESAGSTDIVTCKYCGNTKSVYAILKNNSKKGKGGKLRM